MEKSDARYSSHGSHEPTSLSTSQPRRWQAKCSVEAARLKSAQWSPSRNRERQVQHHSAMLRAVVRRSSAPQWLARKCR